jgi:hypothetical protein
VRRLAFLMVILIFAGCGTSKETPTPQDFAFGLPIETSAEGAIFEAPLPLDFYRGLTGNDANDLCVFNGHGEVVPYAVRRAAQDALSPPAPVPLPFFPIPAKPDGSRKVDDITVQVQRDTTGAVIRLDTAEQVMKEAGIAGYLIDATSLKRPVKALEFQWTFTGDGFVGSLKIEGSDDLAHWSAVGEGGVIANLQYGEHRLVQNRIEFRPMNRKYIRFHWPAVLQQVQLIGASAELVPETAEQPRQWVSVAATVKQGGPGEYFFEAPGPLPVDRIRVKLPQKNTLAAAELFSRDDAKNPWAARGTGLVYQLRMEGEELVNPDFTLSPSPGRFWTLRVRQSGGGLGRGMPEIEMGWIPQHLLFVARGEGPFLLAYGNAQRLFANTRTDDLLAGLPEKSQATASAKPAAFGAQIVLGGETRLKTSPVVDMRKYVLWAVLILAVAVLAWMSLLLYRQMSSRDTDRPQR